MRLTITGANSVLARRVIGALRQDHVIRAVDTRFTDSLPAGVEEAAGDLRDRDFAGKVSDGADAVLHLAPLSINGMDDETVVDTFSRGTYNLADMAIEQGVTRFLVASTLGMYDRLPPEWRVDESWRPRPEPIPEHLACWLAELSLRACCHTAPIRALCLRFGHIVADAASADGAEDARLLHVEDAAHAVERAVHKLAEPTARPEWEIYHISAAKGAKIRSNRARGEGFGYKPQHSFSEIDSVPTGAVAGPNWRDALRPLPMLARAAAGGAGGQHRRSVVIFGSGGPVAAELGRELQDDYRLRQTDVRPLAEVRGENHPQSEGAQLPALLEPPHEEWVVDVRDYAQVLAACEGMDAIVNCTVVRPDAVEAFRVNTLGAYNVMRAAVETGIRRIVQTGPQQMTMDSSTGYWWDYDVPGNAPARPGRNLYAHSKYLGQEICRVYAEYYGLEIPTLVYAQFLNPEVTRSVWVMAVSWRDSARALRAALEVADLPTPMEEIVITNDLPHGRFSAHRAKEVLGWEARDDVSALWMDAGVSRAAGQ